MCGRLTLECCVSNERTQNERVTVEMVEWERLGVRLYADEYERLMETERKFKRDS